MRLNKYTRSVVLLGVLKQKSDLDILRREHWYRMPISRAPKRRFHYLAFYQPASFGAFGKCIHYYARVKSMREFKRVELLPYERKHPRADEMYYRIDIGELQELPQPIRNKRFPARRISFAFTTVRRLRSAKTVLELFKVSETEGIIARALERAKIPAIGEKYVAGTFRGEKRRHFLDFAIACASGEIAIECDNDRAHNNADQRLRDKAKDKFLRKTGWTVIRLSEKQILNHLPKCMARISRAIARLGGPPVPARALPDCGRTRPGRRAGGRST